MQTKTLINRDSDIGQYDTKFSSYVGIISKHHISILVNS